MSRLAPGPQIGGREALLLALRYAARVAFLLGTAMAGGIVAVGVGLVLPRPVSGWDLLGYFVALFALGTMAGLAAGGVAIARLAPLGGTSASAVAAAAPVAMLIGVALLAA